MVLDMSGQDESEGIHTNMPPPPSGRHNPGSLKRLLEKEGYDARNVVSWLVPNRTGGGFVVDARSGVGGRQRGERGSREASRERDHGRSRKSPMSSPFKSSNGSVSSSAKGTPNWRGGRGTDSSALGFNQRLWGYLFRNVNRAVDELYYLCEAEGSVTHCHEAAELLEGCGRDFNKLVDRIIDQTRFEEEQRAARAAENTGQEREEESLLDVGRKPKGLVWEVRKTTSAAGASAIVLSAIERMESQGQGQSQPPTAVPQQSAPSQISPRNKQATVGSPSADSSAAAFPGVPDPPGVSSGNGGSAAAVDHREHARCRPAASVASVSTAPDSRQEGGDTTEVSPATVGRSFRDAGEKRAPRGTKECSAVGAETVGTALRTTQGTVLVAGMTRSKGNLASRLGEASGGNDAMPPGVVERACGEEADEGSIGTADASAGAETGGHTEPVAESNVQGVDASGASSVTESATRRSDGGLAQDEDVVLVAPVCISEKRAITVSIVVDGAGTNKRQTPCTSITSTRSSNCVSEARCLATGARPARDPTATVNDERSRVGDTCGVQDAETSRPTSPPAGGVGVADPNRRRGGSGNTSRLNPRAAPFTYNPPDVLKDQGAAAYTGCSAAPSTGNSRGGGGGRSGGGTRFRNPTDVGAPANDVQHAPTAAKSRSKRNTKQNTAAVATVVHQTRSRERAAPASAAASAAAVPAETPPKASNAARVASAKRPERELEGESDTHSCTSTMVYDTSSTVPKTVDSTEALVAERQGVPRTSVVRMSEVTKSDVSSTGGVGKRTEEVREAGAAAQAAIHLPPDSKWSQRPKLTPDDPKVSPTSAAGSSKPAVAAAPVTASQLPVVAKTSKTAARASATSGILRIGGSNETVADAASVSKQRGGGGRGGGDGGSVGVGDGAADATTCGKHRIAGGDVATASASTEQAGAATGAAVVVIPRVTRRPNSAPADVPATFRRGTVDSKDSGAGGGEDGDKDMSDGCCCDDADADSAYVNAMEKIWAEAEAWVDAEAQAEEEAWARLPAVVPSNPESEGGPSDADDVYRPRDSTATSQPLTLSTPSDRQRTGSPERSGLHTDLEIEIPACDDDDGDGLHSEALAARVAARRGLGTGSAECREEGVFLEEWYHRHDSHGDRAGTHADGYEDDDDEEDEDDEEAKDRLAPSNASSLRTSGSRYGSGGKSWRSPMSSSTTSLSRTRKGRSCDAGGGSGSGGMYIKTPASEGSSGASYFGNERGSCETFDDSWVPFAHRELQKKLSSPQRKPQRKLLSAAEAKRRQERRQMVAELNRAQRASGMAEKLKQHEERARGVRFRKEEQILKAEEEARRKMEGADLRRQEHRRGIVRKASDANSKVDEVLFMNKLTVEDLKITLQMQLEEVDRRIQSGRERRQQLLAGISDRQRRRTKDKAAQMSERRLQAESAAAMRWEALQKRLEAVQQRRRDREKETSRRMQAQDRRDQARERREALLLTPMAGTGDSGEEKALRRRYQEDRASRHGRAAAGGGSSRPQASNLDYGSGEGDYTGTKSLAEIQGKGSDDGENLSDREYYTNTTDGSQRRDSNLNERQDPQVTSDSGDCKHRRGSRRSADASRSTWPPLVGGPALAATGGTGEQTVVPQQPGKRGRAQKKRARKIKEKMRLLCIDANAASIAAAKGAGVSVGGTRSASPNVGVKLNASSPRQSVALNEGGSRNAEKDSDDARASSADYNTTAPTPWPRLERVARDLAALVWVRTSQQQYKAGVDGDGTDRRQDTAPVSSAAEPGRQVPTPHAVRSDRDSDANATTRSSALPSADGTGVAVLDSSSAAEAVRSRGDTGEVVVHLEKADSDCSLVHSSRGAIEFAAPPEPKGGSMANTPGGGATRPPDDGAGTKNDHVTQTSQMDALQTLESSEEQAALKQPSAIVPKRTDGIVVAGTSDVKGPGGVVEPAATDTAPEPPRRKKTRRGRRAGGVLNRRRGAKAKVAKCEDEGAVGGSASEVINIAGDLDPGMVVSLEAASSAEDTAGEPGALVRRQFDERPTPNAHHVTANETGSTMPATGTVAAADTRSSAAMMGTDAGPRTTSAEYQVGSMQEPDVRSLSSSRGSSIPVPVLEHAAAISIQDLRSILLNTSASTSEGKREAQDMPSSAISPSSYTTASANARLHLQLRRRRIIESLLALSAPFPWFPVLPAVPRVVREGSRQDEGKSNAKKPGSTAETSKDAAASTTRAERPGQREMGCNARDVRVGKPGATSPGHLRQSSTSSSSRLSVSTPSLHSPPAPAARRSEASSPTTRKGKSAVEGDGGSAASVDTASTRKELLMASAFAALRCVLEDSRNVESVFAMDGAAPLVDNLSRLLERAIRRSHASSMEPTLFITSNSVNSRPVGYEECFTDSTRPAPNPRSGRALREGARVVPSSDPGRSRGDLAFFLEPDVEEGLCTGLEIVRLLLRHVPLSYYPARIQEELVRYLLAKRVLTDLSHLLGYLHACRQAEEISGLASVTDGGDPSRQPRGHRPGAKAARTERTSASSSSPSSTPSSPSYRFTPRIVGLVVELVDAVMSFPFSSAPSSPSLPLLERTEGRAISAEARHTASIIPAEAGVTADRNHTAAATPNSDHGVGVDGGNTVDTAKVDENGSIGSISCDKFGDVARGKAAPEEDLVAVCVGLEDLSDGRMATRGGTACGTTVTAAPGGAELVATVVQLLASMATAEGRAPPRHHRAEGKVTRSAVGIPTSFATDADAGIPLSDEFLSLACKIMHAINKVAVLNLASMQTWLSVEGVRLDFATLCERLLISIIDDLDSQSAAATTRARQSGLSLSEERLESVVMLLGYFCLGNRKNQEMLQWGPPPTILVRLCNLPFRFFSETRYQAVLFPTLISICNQNVRNRDVAENDLATEVFADFLEQHLSRHVNGETHKGQARPTPAACDITVLGRLLSHRLPVAMWNEAITFFRGSPEPNRATLA